MTDLGYDYLTVRTMVTDAVARYVRRSAAPATAAAHGPVTRIDLEPYLGEVPNVTLHFDAGTNPWPGDGSHRCFASAEFPAWLAGFEAIESDGEIQITDLEGAPRTVTPAKSDQVFHGFFADALRLLRDEGAFDPLPKARGCELGVMCFECGWCWPDEEDRGLVNRADPREPPRPLSTEPPRPEAQRVAEDATAYDVWADAGAVSPAKAAAAIHSALGVALPAVRNLIASGQPVARDVKAAEVRRLAEALRRAGVGVVVEPRFRWTLD
jgi:hypothetical protein